MKKKFLVCMSLIIASCSSSYICESNSEIPIYSDKSEKSDTVFMIPTKTKVIVTGKLKKFKKIKFDNYEGWTNSNSFQYISKKSTERYQSSSTNKSNNSNKSNKTVNVKGYYRKNGTYVKPYTRSAPKSSKRK